MKKILAVALVLAAFPLAAAPLRLAHDVVPLREAVSLKMDPRADTYGGTATFELDVKKVVPSFNLHAEEMNIDKVTIDGAPATSASGPEHTLVITPASPLKIGHSKMTIDFSNDYDRHAVGLYKMMHGEEPYLFTQFESIDARKAFPCWDEPGFKIPFSITATIPSKYEVVANTPVAAQKESDGWKTVQFAETRPLPSYLVAFAVGALEFTPVPGTSIPTRVVTVKGESGMTGVTVEQTPKLLAALESYFGSRYPFEKLDLIGVPEYWYGAMENPGLITYDDDILVIDPRRVTPSSRRTNARVTAHELAHMWFGDLVTMQWWDDLWLNESFADWMGDKIADSVYPEYGIALNEMENVGFIMNADASPLTMPIQNHDTTPEEAMNAVGLAYNKGKAVIGMFERWLGPEEFRKGVQRHLKAHAWGNAVAADFWSALGKQTAAPMETFIAQSGLPLITASITGPNEITLAQTRYLHYGVKANAQTWIVPVALRYSDGEKTRVTTLLLDAPSKKFTLDAKKIAWLYPHADAVGYYRWSEPAAQFATISAKATDVLTPKERMAFLGNLSALLDAGVIHGNDYLETLQRFSGETDPQVLGSIMNALGKVRQALPESDRALFAKYVRRTLSPALERIGYARTQGEPQTVTILRPRLLATVANVGEDPKAIAFAKDLAAKYMQDPASVDATLAATAMSVTVHNTGDAAMYEEMRKRFEAAATPAERNLYLGAIASFRDPELRRKALDYALTSAVRPTELFTIPFGYLDSDEGRAAVFAWTLANYDTTIRKSVPGEFLAGMPRLGGGCDEGRLARTREFFLAPERKVNGTEREMARTEEQVKECVAFRQREGDALRAFLQRAN